MPDIALVSYINTRPFVDGLEATYGKDGDIRLHLLPPSDCARALFDGQADLALIPVGSIPTGPTLALLPTWCIGADGPVDSVFLFSQKPIEEIDQVWLDRHSRSSNGLAQILMRYHWKKEVRWLEPVKKHFDQIQEHTAGVVIGDEAIRIRDQFAYQYDLAEVWRDMTGLPFVFAVWAYNPGTINQSEIQRIEEALGNGVLQAETTAENWAGHFGMGIEAAKAYLTESIDYQFDARKHQALELYVRLLEEVKCVPSP